MNIPTEEPLNFESCFTTLAYCDKIQINVSEDPPTAGSGDGDRWAGQSVDAAVQRKDTAV